MKIIAYNINRYSQEKVDKILAMGADVFILPEVACPKMVNLPEGYQMEWMGNCSLGDRHMGHTLIPVSVAIYNKKQNV